MEEQQTMIEWQMKKMSEAEESFSKSGITKNLIIDLRKNRNESKHSKLSHAAPSHIANIKVNPSLYEKHFVTSSVHPSKFQSKLLDNQFRNRTLTEHDLRNSSDSLPSRTPLARPRSGNGQS